MRTHPKSRKSTLRTAGLVELNESDLFSSQNALETSSPESRADQRIPGPLFHDSTGTIASLFTAFLGQSLAGLHLSISQDGLHQHAAYPHIFLRGANTSWIELDYDTSNSFLGVGGRTSCDHCQQSVDILTELPPSFRQAVTMIEWFEDESDVFGVRFTMSTGATIELLHGANDTWAWSVWLRAPAGFCIPADSMLTVNTCGAVTSVAWPSSAGTPGLTPRASSSGGKHKIISIFGSRDPFYRWHAA